MAAAAFKTSLTVADLPSPNTVTIDLGGTVHVLSPTARLSSAGNPMLFAVGKVTDGKGNRYQVNVMLTRIDDSPEAQAARKAARK